MSPWYYGVAEREHDIQNPSSREKIRLLGERMRLSSGSRVLDVASGRGGPALVLAAEFGCSLTCIERDPGFAEAARARADGAGLGGLVDVVNADAREVALDPAAYDAVMCLGATFVWGGLDGTFDALLPAVRRGGFLAVGEPYWRTWPLPADIADEGYAPLAATVERFEASGIPVVSLIAASEDDWDRYVTLQWRACEEWLAEDAGDAEAPELRARLEQVKERYLTVERDHLGWAIFVGWSKAATPPS